MINKRYNRGFSLIELVVALGIASVILATGAAFLNSTLKQYGKDNYEIKLQTEVEEILNLLENWIMDAENLSVVPGEGGNNDSLKLEKTLLDGSAISSTVYSRDGNIYYDKQYSDRTTEVYLGTHIHINTEVEDHENQKNLIFSLSENKKMVYVTINMSFGSSSYNATRKILLRNWKEEETSTSTEGYKPSKDVKASIASSNVNIIVPQNSHKSELSIEIGMKNTGGDISLETINGSNGIEIKVYFFFGAKDGVIPAISNKDNWSCDGGNITSVTVEKYPGTKKDNQGFDLYYGCVNVKSTLDLMKDPSVAGSGWQLNHLITHTLKCNVAGASEVNMKMNEYNSYGISKDMTSTYIEVLYSGNPVCSYGNKGSIPDKTPSVPIVPETEASTETETETQTNPVIDNLSGVVIDNPQLGHMYEFEKNIRQVIVSYNVTDKWYGSVYFYLGPNNNEYHAPSENEYKVGGEHEYTWNLAANYKNINFGVQNAEIHSITIVFD